MASDYRPDIDGLRMIAVLPVLAFHFDRPWAPGGFVGVDVFFVISGFLITRIIQREMIEGTFSLTSFYVRRIRRILPALTVMCLAALGVCYVLFLPSHLEAAGRSLVAAAAFASNILFWQEAGYFEAAAYTKPLLHTWSLAIEEQFYIFVPLILMLLFRWRQRPIIWIGALSLASFALSALTTERIPTAAYYLLPWRAWELGVGAMIALAPLPQLKPRALREGATAIGLVLILFAVISLDKSTPFPGVAALLPVLGAALVIYAGACGPTTCGALLGSTLPVWIGKRSYSLYLWHWPLVVFYAYSTMDLPGPWVSAGLLLASFVMAELSYRFVEQPFRHPKAGAKSAPTLLGGIGVTAVMGAVGLLFVLGNGMPGRLPTEVSTLAAFSEDKDPQARACERRQNGKDWSEPCLFGAAEGPSQIILMGDSHGFALWPALDEAARSVGVQGQMLAHNGCPNFPEFQVYWAGHEHDCAPFFDATWEQVLADPDAELVVIALRAQIYAHGWPRRGFAEGLRSELTIGDWIGPLPADADRTDFFLGRFDLALGQLRNAGKEVLLVYPLPEATLRIPQAAARMMLRGGDPTEALAIPREDYDARTARLIAGYDALVAKHNLQTVRLQDRFCDAEKCQTFIEDVPLYRDSNHLTATAARILGADISEALDGIQ